MISKSEAKYIQSLYHKKTRESEGLFLVEGPKIVDELLSSTFQVKQVYATDEWQATTSSVPVQRISQQDLERISGLQTPNQVLAIAVQRQNPKPKLKGKISLLLDGIQDPGNLGTIIRIADWFGVSQIIASHETVELYNPKVLQSTMGSFIRVSVWYRDLKEVIEEVGLPVFGAVLNGRSVVEMEKIQEGLLVIGNESKGISPGLMALITDPVTIPRIGGAESLNAAVATGIILSHLAG